MNSNYSQDKRKWTGCN